MTSRPARICYVVPFRRWNREPLGEFGDYLAALPDEVDAVVVDGSGPALFDYHAAGLPSRVRHVRLQPRDVTLNGKVGGVCAGIALATCECVVVADDDVRYDAAALRALGAALDGADVVRPQNYFEPAPWHAIWDTSRTLLARISGGDWPGTLAVRKSTFGRTNGYAGDVLFENLELVRAIRRAGGRERVAYDVYVGRRPPTVRRFCEQRVRQAYDEFARPLRLAAFLTIVPLLCVALATQRWRTIAGVTAAIVVAAECGRRRAGGRAYFAAAASFAAPLWLLERGICSWLALDRRYRCGGIRYAGCVLRRAAA
ncbi:MAG: glycosyltransferase family 2 protein [Candidatus Eremiobacteraeota bacterium]|nr:glycosyltransferase family 2 protein [Candidatus Eremiobacteraeota bacterium]MBC5804310.1 glycosyltransferase family 2 protein [Candidatus Eremiobacteraeota bacterium]MBC5822081.1 glycosyltransferase family 2 protein [Candidatus Eremiobacteraeota bacterium]